MPWYDNLRILTALVIIYVGLVSLLIWLGWTLGSAIERVLGKPNGKWIKYLIIAIVIPVSLAYCIIPSAFVFHYLLYEPLPESIWGVPEYDDTNDK